MPSITAHSVKIVTDRVADHGYPHRAVCTCGWKSWGYVRTHAAQIMADDHIQKEA
jgi:hypothetical protein